MTRAAILSLGGSSRPLAKSLAENREDIVLFFASEDSQNMLDELRKELEENFKGRWPTTVELCVTPDHQDLLVSYKSLAEFIPVWMARHKLDYPDIRVDFTGGTKVMSVALIMFGEDRFRRLSYVGGKKRTKEGVGVVENGMEEVLDQLNPYDLTLARRFRRWRELTRLCRYEVVAGETRELKERLSDRTRGKEFVGAAADIYAALAAWDRFEHPEKFVLPKYRKGLERLKTIAATLEHPDISKWVQELEELEAYYKSLCDAWRGDKEGIALDIVANADRRVQGEQKFEDAVARFYSAMERFGQVRLRERTGFKASQFPLEKIPEQLREKYSKREKVLKLGLVDVMSVLSELTPPEELGQRFFQAKKVWIGAAGEKRGSRTLLEMRNYSILGHGTTGVTKKDYEQFRTELIKLVGIREEALPSVPDFPIIEWL